MIGTGDLCAKFQDDLLEQVVGDRPVNALRQVGDIAVAVVGQADGEHHPTVLLCLIFQKQVDVDKVPLLLEGLNPDEWPLPNAGACQRVVGVGVGVVEVRVVAHLLGGGVEVAPDVRLVDFSGVGPAAVFGEEQLLSLLVGIKLGNDSRIPAEEVGAVGVVDGPPVMVVQADNAGLRRAVCRRSTKVEHRIPHQFVVGLVGGVRRSMLLLLGAFRFAGALLVGRCVWCSVLLRGGVVRGGRFRFGGSGVLLSRAPALRAGAQRKQQADSQQKGKKAGRFHEDSSFRAICYYQYSIKDEKREEQNGRTAKIPCSPPVKK